jgi:hypothetical protein
MMQQKAAPNAVNVELVKDMMAHSVFSHDMMSILYSETRSGAQKHELSFAIEFKDNKVYEGRDGRPECRAEKSSGFILTLAEEGFGLGTAYLARQKEAGSTESSGEAVFSGVKLPEGKCDSVFRSILHAHDNSEKPLLLDKLSRATDALHKMYSEDLETVNACYFIPIREALSLLNRIGYAAQLASEKIDEDRADTLGLKRA